MTWQPPADTQKLRSIRFFPLSDLLIRLFYPQDWNASKETILCLPEPKQCSVSWWGHSPFRYSKEGKNQTRWEQNRKPTPQGKVMLKGTKEIIDKITTINRLNWFLTRSSLHIETHKYGGGRNNNDTREVEGTWVSPVPPSCPWSALSHTWSSNPISEAPQGRQEAGRIRSQFSPSSYLFLQAGKCFRTTECHISPWSPDRATYRGSITFWKDIHWHYPRIFHKMSFLLNLSLEEKNCLCHSLFISYKGLYFQLNLCRRKASTPGHLQSSFYSMWFYYPQGLRRLRQISCRSGQSDEE